MGSLSRTGDAVRALSGRDASAIGADVALLVLRVILAAGMGAHGLIKVFGFFGGPGLDHFEQALVGFGFTTHLRSLAWLTGLTEVGASALLVLGLCTPLAAAGLLGIAASVVVSKWRGGFFEGQGQGFELELTFAAIALALLLMGPGRLALDAKAPWGKQPLPYGVMGVVVAVVSAVTMYAAFR